MSANVRGVCVIYLFGLFSCFGFIWLTGVPFAKLAAHNQNTGPQVSFDRPWLSPCLVNFEDKNHSEYIEALAIIEAGKQMLQQRPRADMPGFEACTIDQQRQQNYKMRQQAEARNRKAIQNGQKLYDFD